MRMLLRDRIRSVIILLLFLCTITLISTGIMIYLSSNSQLMKTEESVLTIAVQNVLYEKTVIPGTKLEAMRRVKVDQSAVDAMLGQSTAIREIIQGGAYVALSPRITPVTSGQFDELAYSYAPDETWRYAVLRVTCRAVTPIVMSAYYVDGKPSEETRTMYEGTFALDEALSLAGAYGAPEQIEFRSSDVKIEEGKSYVVTGKYYDIPVVSDFSENPFIPVYKLDTSTPPYIQIDRALSPDETDEIATLTRDAAIRNRRLFLFTVDDPRALYAFHQETQFLLEGRYYTEEEAARGAPVCLIASDMALYNGLSVGDTVPLSVFESTFTTQFFIGADYVPDLLTPVEADGLPLELTIVGIYNAPNYRISGHTNFGLPLNMLFTPVKTVPLSSRSDLFCLKSVVLKNGQGDKFLAEVTAAGFREDLFTVYDDGYARLSETFGKMAREHALLMAVMTAIGLMICALSAYVFMNHKREEFFLLHCLGTPGGRTERGLLGYFAVLSLISLLLSAALLLALREPIIQFMNSVYFYGEVDITAFVVSSGLDGAHVTVRQIVMGLIVSWIAVNLVAAAVALPFAKRKCRHAA